MIMNNLYDQPLYSPDPRQQDIADGALIDLSQNETIREFWKYPFACSKAVWECIETASYENRITINEMLDSISTWAERKIAERGDADVATFHAMIGARLLHFKLQLDHGDEHECKRVLTLTFVGDD